MIDEIWPMVCDNGNKAGGSKKKKKKASGKKAG
jgi:hypothetical protein